MEHREGHYQSAGVLDVPAAVSGRARDPEGKGRKKVKRERGSGKNIEHESTHSARVSRRGEDEESDGQAVLKQIIKGQTRVVKNSRNYEGRWPKKVMRTRSIVGEGRVVCVRHQLRGCNR